MITCDFCHWTNVELLNLGGPGKTKWICHACVKREIDSKTDLLDQLTKAQAKIAAYEKLWNDMHFTICKLEQDLRKAKGEQ